MRNLPFILFALVWIVGGNLVAWYFQWHVEIPAIGWCQGYGC